MIARLAGVRIGDSLVGIVYARAAGRVLMLLAFIRAAGVLTRGVTPLLGS
jgi:hypothetical protein